MGADVVATVHGSRALIRLLGWWEHWALVECHADPLFPAPYDVAEHMLTIRWQCQGELLGDFDRVSHVEHCAGFRDIANHAIDCTAAEPNRSGLENTMSRCITVLVHGVPKIGPKT